MTSVPEKHTDGERGDSRFGDAINVTAHSVADPFVDRALVVENVRSETHGSGRHVTFTVRNVGSTQIPQYGIGVFWFRPEE